MCSCSVWCEYGKYKRVYTSPVFSFYLWRTDRFKSYTIVSSQSFCQYVILRFISFSLASLSLIIIDPRYIRTPLPTLYRVLGFLVCYLYLFIIMIFVFFLFANNPKLWFSYPSLFHKSLILLSSDSVIGVEYRLVIP